MNLHKITPQLVIAVLLAVFFGVALYFRVYFPYDRVFGVDWLKFTGTDAYYHMRIVDNLVHNFPHIINFDPYFIYPGGNWVTSIHFFDWLLAGITWVIGLGSPAQTVIDVVGAYYPAFLGALTVIPVYFIGKEIFNRWAGVLAAALIAIMPGEFVGRTILGFTDNPAAEVLFTSLVMLFLVLTVKTAGQRHLAFGHIRKRDWAVAGKPVIYALLTGIALGIYLISWAGGLLFVFIILVYLVIQFITDHLRKRPTDYLGITGGIFFLISLLIFLPFSLGTVYSVSLIIALLIPLVMAGVSRLMSGGGIKAGYYPLTLIVGGVVVAVVFHFVNPSLLSGMLGKFDIFFPAGATAITTTEMQSLFSSQQVYLAPIGETSSLIIAWGNFNTGFYFSLISMLILLYLVVKRGEADKTLLLVWSLVILLLAIGQRRFCYYFAVNVAVLTGYFSVLCYYIIRFIIDKFKGNSTGYMSWQIFELAGFNELATAAPELPAGPAEVKARTAKAKKAKPARERKSRFRPTVIHISMTLWILFAVFFLAFFPDVGAVVRAMDIGRQNGITVGEVWWYQCLAGSAMNVAQRATYAPSDAWQETLTWMKNNTPEPFGSADYYYELYDTQRGDEYIYPESAYGVTAWWDYGYWITRIAHRLPNTNNSQAAGPIADVANFFLSTGDSPDEALRQKLDSEYIILHNDTTGSKFWAMFNWIDGDESRFIAPFYRDVGGGKIQLQGFYYTPAYYRTLCVRLYNFDGREVVPENIKVFSFKEEVTLEGWVARIITGEEDFTSYEDALEYIESRGAANSMIVGTNSFVSPVPLNALEDYRLVYSSDDSVEYTDTGIAVPEVKVFEYVR